MKFSRFQSSSVWSFQITNPDITLCPAQNGGEPALFYAIILLAFLPRASTEPREKLIHLKSCKSLNVFVSIYDRILAIHYRDVYG